jgi:hypothetical protein
MEALPMNTPPQDEEIFKEYFQALLKKGQNISDFARYELYDDFLCKVAREMYEERLNHGVRGLKAYLLRKMENPAYEPLRPILGDAFVAIQSEVGTLLSDVKPQEISWLWHPYLALGKLATFDGDPSLGKTTFGIGLGARTTQGENMPDGTPCPARGGVVVIMPEDGLADTIQPRFARAGADLSKVIDLSTVKADDDDDDDESRRPFQLQSDLGYLEAAIRLVDAKLVYIDPLMAVVGGNTDTYRDDEVRALLLPLKLLVEKHQVACILVRHMTKTRGPNPLMAGNGSIGFIGLVRTGLMVVQSPADKSQVILSHIKSNIGPLAPDLTYTICSDAASGDDRPYLVWGNETKLSGLDSIAAPRKNTRGKIPEGDC